MWPLSSEKSSLFVAGRTLADWEEELGERFNPKYPWDLFDLNELLLMHIFFWPGHPSIKLIDGGRVIVGEGSTILPGVVVSGNVLIGKNCSIGPNCYLRRDTSIGDHCHVGNAVEIKNSILAPDTAVAHLSYVGDSYLDRGVNLGAGTITANYRHDGFSHRTEVNGKLVDTDLNKLGAIIGEGVRTGINTSIYPGRKLGPHTTTRPGEIVSKDLREV